MLQFIAAYSSIRCLLVATRLVCFFKVVAVQPGVGSMICSQCFRQGVSALVADASAVHLILHKVESKGEPSRMDSLCWMRFWVGSRSLNAVNQKLFAVLPTVTAGGKRTKEVRNHAWMCMA